MSALARYAQAKSALFPSLSIGGSFGLSGSIMGQLGEWGTHNSNGFGSLTLPIFNAGSLMAQVEQRDAQAAQAKIDYEASLLTGVQDVEDALNKVWSQETRKNHWSLPTSRHETLRQPHGRITVPAFRTSPSC